MSDNNRDHKSKDVNKKRPPHEKEDVKEPGDKTDSGANKHEKGDSQTKVSTSPTTESNPGA